MNTRVLLINPALLEFEPNKEFTPPLSLLYLGGILLHKGADVRILELNRFHPWKHPDGYGSYIENHVLSAVEEFQPHVIGITSMFSGQFPGIMRYSQRIKDSNPGIPIVIGGCHPSLYAREILQYCPQIDYIVYGEGEEQAAVLLDVIRNNDRTPLAGLEGIAYRDNGSIVFNKKTHFIENLDALPDPAYGLINIRDYYHDTSHWHNPRGLKFQMTFPILSSRSCPNKCNFCSNYLIMGCKIRLRSAIKVADELQYLYDRFGQNHFSFMDDNITLSKRHILTLCNEVLRRQMKIQFETPNGVFLRSLDKEVMDAMVAAGWVRGALAIESGSEYMRNEVMGKRLSREKIDEVVGVYHTHPNLYLKGAFMMGFPEETNATLQDSYDLIKQMQLDEVFMTNLMPYPGTEVFDQCRRDGLFTDEIDYENLWRATGFHYHTNKKFYIKPYQMTLDELQGWRDKFDALIDEVGRAQRAVKKKGGARTAGEHCL